MAGFAELKDFPQDEQDDFDEACARHGRHRSQFIVQAAFEYAGDEELKRIVGNVLVSFDKLTRPYQRGHMIEPWVYSFERDLRAGIFGP